MDRVTTAWYHISVCKLKQYYETNNCMVSCMMEQTKLCKAITSQITEHAFMLFISRKMYFNYSWF